MSNAHTGLWELLGDIEDQLNGGFRTARPAVKFSPESESGFDAIAEEIAGCTRCGLSQARTHTVPGTGVMHPQVMVIGEAPGADEDHQGLPFVGPAGKYLDKWLEAIGLSRTENCFIANVVKCRPPGNRDPLPDESTACLPYLNRQIEILKPAAILTVGRIATQILLETTRGIGATRGRQYSYRGTPLIATYHPSGVLRNPEYRKAVWDDLRLMQNLLEAL